MDFKSCLTTHQSESFCLGTASREYGGQSDVLMAHYHREGADRPGVFYTRYLLDDKWLGDFYHATDRTKSRNLMDEGQFRGVQSGPRAIGLFTPQRLSTLKSAKACLIFTQREHIDEIWVGDRRITSLPTEVPNDTTIVIGSGDAYFAIRPLTRTDIGRGAPIRLVEKKGDLVLEIYNYLGSPKSFWEMRQDGPFFQGHPQCGVYFEAAEQSAHTDGQAFAQLVDSGELKDQAAAPFVTDGETERPWSVEYTRNGQTLGIEIDLMTFALSRRWTQNGDLGWPMLNTSLAVQNRTGRIKVGNAVLECGQDAGWLYASPNQNLFIAGYHGPTPAPLTLAVPNGKVEIGSLSCGTVTWRDDNATIDALDLKGEPKITGDD